MTADEIEDAALDRGVRAFNAVWGDPKRALARAIKTYNAEHARLSSEARQRRLDHQAEINVPPIHPWPIDP